MAHLAPLQAVILAAALAAAAAPARAQSPPETPETGVQVGIETRRDRFSYHFDSPSSFDTAGLVPHFFEQHYVADNLWIVVSAHYTAGIKWETRFGATPQRTRTGDDYDTFFQPDGSVIVSGTTGGVSIRSLLVSQRGELATFGPVALIAGYQLRIDRSDFQLGHKTVTRNGVVLEAFDVTTPEATSSWMHEVQVGARVSGDVGLGWRVTLDGAIAPTMLGRLLIQLPEKYPGQDLIFRANGAAGNVRVALMRPRDRWPIEVAVDAGHTWRYSSTAWVARDLLGLRVTIGH
jgi:hypothetical protein